MSRFRSMPLAVRILLALLPIIVCVPLICAAAILVQEQMSGSQSATATVARRRTLEAAEATNRAENQQHIAETATALLASQQAGDRATATALAVMRQQQALTLTALATPTFTASPTAAITPTSAIVFTARPKTVTVTLRECRGDEGTVFFGQAQPQSLGAYKSISFTVPPGSYHLRIDWLRKPENNVNTDIEVTRSTTLAFGDQCR